MKGSKGYLLAEVLVCLAAAVIICYKRHKVNGAAQRGGRSV